MRIKLEDNVHATFNMITVGLKLKITLDFLIIKNNYWSLF